MTCRTVAVALGFAAMMMTTTAAQAQDPADLKIETTQTPARERDTDAADVGFVDKAKRWAEEKRIADRLSPREGVYARFGGMTTGSGLALGAGYRKYFLDERIFSGRVGGALDEVVQGGRREGAVGAASGTIASRSGRTSATAIIRRRTISVLVRTSSPATVPATASKAPTSSAALLLKVLPWLSVGTDIGFFNPTLGPGTDDSVPVDRAVVRRHRCARARRR